MRKILLTFAALAAATACLHAQQAQPKFAFTYPDGKQLVEAVSDNGQWAVTQGAATEEGSLLPTGGTLYHLPDMKEYTVIAADTYAGVADVSDDGKTVVGELDGMPASWNADTKQWTKYPVPTGYNGGRLHAVSADGSRAVGFAYVNQEQSLYVPLAIDLKTGKEIELTNLPELDMNHEDSGERVFQGISGDGRYAVGSMTRSVMTPVSMFSFVYDLDNNTYKVVGFTENATAPWTPSQPDLYFVDSCNISPNGQWCTGMAYLVKDPDAEVAGAEYHVAYRFNVQTGEMEVYDDEGDSDMQGQVVCNDGTVLAASPAENPYPTCMVRSGKYYYSMEQVMRQKYGIDFLAKTGQEISGYPFAVSADGRVISGGTSVGGWTVTLPDPIGEACQGINLLENYTAAPATGSSFSYIQNVTVTFDRSIATTGKPADIKLLKADGTAVRNATGANVDASGTKLSISFRSTQLEDGQGYKVVIPAGFVTLKNDPTMANQEITFEYTGIPAGHVALTETYPADGATIAKLDLNSSYILLTFNATLSKGEDSHATLYRVGDETPVCTLSTGVKNNQALLYPAAGTQYLYDGTDYKVVIPAGAFRDVAGFAPSEEITLNLHGSYVREIDSDDTYVFRSDCSDYAKFMFYMGNFNEPAQTPASWGFTAQTPCVAISDDNQATPDLAYALHSMYTPAGQSDSWVITPQLFIPDAKCSLSFKGQSYLKSKQDRLRVYIYVDDENVQTPSKEWVEKIRATEPVIDTVLTPGASEESLSGDWQNFGFDMAPYAGKHVYVAFSNYNYDQSAIFLDDIAVARELKYLISFTNPERVVARESLPITGTVTVNNPVDTYTTLSMELLDADGVKVSDLTTSGLALKQGDHYNFTFPAELGLVSGQENKFTVNATLGDDASSATGAVKCLMFPTTKRVLIEEYSGQSCSNCPRGFVAIDHLLDTYGDRVVPVILRTYGGDKLSSGLGEYSQYLGLDGIGAPSASIDRAVNCGPMPQDKSNGHYVFSLGDIANPADCPNPEDSWFDRATEVLAQPADCNLAASANVDPATGELTAYVHVNYALDADNQNLLLFGVVTEDGCKTSQSNGMAHDESPAMGEWGANGLYNRSFIKEYYLDHVARGILGDSFAGTPGLLPASFAAGQQVTATVKSQLSNYVTDWTKCHVNLVMLDGNTDRVINCVRTPLQDVSSVHSISDEAQAPADVYNLQGVCVLRAATPEQVRQLPAGLYIHAGRKILVR